MLAPNIGEPKHIKKILEGFKEQRDSNTVIVWDFNAPLSTMDRSSRQKINKDIVALNDTLDQMDLIDNYRTFYFLIFIYLFFKKIFIVIQLQLYAFSPHPSTPPQVNPPPSPTSTLPPWFCPCVLYSSSITEHFIPKKQNIHSSQVHMDHSQR